MTDPKREYLALNDQDAHCEVLPKALINRTFREAAQTQAKRLVSLIRHSILNLYILCGEFDGEQLSVLVADDGFTFDYVHDLVFERGADYKKIGKISAFSAPKLADYRADIVFIGANQLLVPEYVNKGFLIVPRWVRLYCPTTEHPDKRMESFSKSARRDIRRNLMEVVENGFSYETTNSPDWLDEFYQRMYKPYIYKKYGDKAIVHGYGEVKRAFTMGSGIVLKKQERPVGGAIVYTKDSVMSNPFVGILDGDEELARDGASRALYYYTMLLAHSSGCVGVDFGHCRPFLCDGSLQYKLKWRMHVLDDNDGIGVFAIATPGNSNVAQRFLTARRFFHLTDERVQLSDDKE